MIDYALAKELKAAGFPQNRADTLYYPTLEELIEACGKKIQSLEAPRERHRYWQAWSVNGEFTYGSTLTEAVARLWLALNKKEV